jgi:preprotein translocase SecE subunit
MATATKTIPEAPPRDPVKQLAVASFLGALYVLFCLGLVFGQLPILWDLLGIQEATNPFLSDALLLIVSLCVIVGLVFVGWRLEGSHALPGLHAGILVASVGLFLILLISLGLGNGLVAKGEVGFGIGLSVVVAVLLLGGLVLLFLLPGFAQLLIRFDEQGWLHLRQYKPNQGVRVRRGTFLGLLMIIGFGIWTMVLHGTLGKGNWYVDLLNTDYALYLMFHVAYIGPVIILLALGWISWRVVNWPLFADFLIATEAELNKVSWTTRRRLIQDSVVVLVTVFLMAVFLFGVDIAWIRILSIDPWIKVLQVDPRAERAKQNRPSEW